MILIARTEGRGSLISALALYLETAYGTIIYTKLAIITQVFFSFS